jgi:riboflavin kinase/FMN adenylyltransferase
MNIGVKPTLGDNSPTIEVHLLDFSEDIYGQEIQVNLIERLRDEQKFESFEALKSQLEIDKINTVDYFKKGNS